MKKKARFFSLLLALTLTVPAVVSAEENDGISEISETAVMQEEQSSEESAEIWYLDTEKPEQPEAEEMQEVPETEATGQEECEILVAEPASEEIFLEEPESSDTSGAEEAPEAEFTAPEEAGTGTGTVTKEQIQKLGAYKAIQSALNTARENATEANPYTVTVEAGSYDLTYSLHIYSHTKLVLTGVTLTRKGEKTQKNMLMVGDTDEAASGVTGYYYKDISVEGGTFDGNSDDGYVGTMIKAGHTDGFTMKNVTAKNCLNAHIMETAGVRNLTVSYCSFSNQVTDGQGELEAYHEALQLDILSSEHMNGYRSEPLATTDVTVDHCTFTNVPRGVGSHTAILNNPMSNVQVTNCTFTDIKSVAIQFLYTKNLTIANNTISDAPRGIAVYQVEDGGLFCPSALAEEGGVSTSLSDAYQTPGDLNISITGNQITMTSEKDPYSDAIHTGIYTGGVSVSSGSSIPAGDYYMNGADISGNTIQNAQGHGIRLEDARNCNVQSNTVTYPTGTSASDNYFGIMIKGSGQNGAINENTVLNAPSYGIHIYSNAGAESISGNTVEGSGIIGIFAEKNATVDSISGNTVSNASEHGITVNASVVATMSKNQISNAGRYGIFVNLGGKVTTISENTVRDSGENGISVNGATVTTVTGNTVSNSKSRGISVYNDGEITTITKNTVTDCGDIGIYTNGGTITTVSDNTVKNCTNLGIKAVSNGFMKNVTGNTVISPGQYGIRFSSGGLGELIEKNTVTGATKKAIDVDNQSRVTKIGVNYTTLAPTLVSAKNGDGQVTVTWKKVSGAGGYRIYRKSGAGKWAKLKDVSSSAASYRDTSVKSGTTYTYTVCALSDGAVCSKYDTKGVGVKYLAMPSVSISNTAKGVTVSWKKISGASGYYVYRKAVGGSYKKIASLSGNGKISFTDTAVKNANGTRYIYAVKAYSGKTVSAFTEKNFYRLTATSITSAANTAEKKITVSWKKNSKCTGYQIKYVTGKTKKTVEIGQSGTVKKEISSLRKNATYKIYLRCYVKKSGVKYYSAWSAASQVKVTR